MGSQQFSLRWKNHQTNLLTVFDQLLQNEAFVDVTLACDGLSIKAHKMVLSACSPYFQNLFIDNPCKHPIVILKDVKFVELKAIIDFMYKGEVNVSQDQLSVLLRTAETLQIKGLAEVTGNNCQEELRKSLSDSSSCPDNVEDENCEKSISSGENDRIDKAVTEKNNSPARKKRRLAKFNNNDEEEKSENESVFHKTDESRKSFTEEKCDETYSSRNTESVNEQDHEIQEIKNENNTWDVDESNELSSTSVQCDHDNSIQVLNLQPVSETGPPPEHLPLSTDLTASNTSSTECPQYMANWAEQNFLTMSSENQQIPTDVLSEPSTSANVTNSGNGSRKANDCTQDGFKCTLCSKSFNDSKSLIQHSNLHLQKFECDVCGTCFANQRDLRRHEHRHIPIHLREPQFECQECGKRFHNQGSLVNHRNVHKERFKCDLCGHCSQSKVMLEKHIRIHL